jgi:hypothetical protein
MAPTAENFRVFFAAFDDRQRAIETGTVLRERVAEIEQLATAVFERERIDRTHGNNRYAQIIREYEDPQVGQWPSAQRHKYRELNGYEALAKDQISTALYCAARALAGVPGAVARRDRRAPDRGRRLDGAPAPALRGA